MGLFTRKNKITEERLEERLDEVIKIHQMRVHVQEECVVYPVHDQPYLRGPMSTMPLDTEGHYLPYYDNEIVFSERHMGP